MVGDVQVGRVPAAGVLHPVFPAPLVLYHPFPRLHEVTQVCLYMFLTEKKKYKNLSEVIRFFVFRTPDQTHLVDDNQQSSVGPGSQFHAAVLHIKGEMEDTDLAVALEDGRRVPDDLPRVLQQHLSLVDDGEVAIGAAEERSSDGCDG